MIIMVIPSKLCFSIFLIISYNFPWCFRMFPIVSLWFLQVFLLFPLSFSPTLNFAILCLLQFHFNNNLTILSWFDFILTFIVISFIIKIEYQFFFCFSFYYENQDINIVDRECNFCSPILILLGGKLDTYYYTEKCAKTLQIASIISKKIVNKTGKLSYYKLVYHQQN